MTYIMRNDDLLLRMRQAVERRLRRLPYMEEALGLGHRLARANHMRRLPVLTPRLREVWSRLETHGCASASLMELGLSPEPALGSVEPHLQALRAREVRPDTRELMSSNADLLEHSEPMRFGLTGALLDLAEVYLGLPVNYLGVNVKREVANGVHGGTRMWHRDHEDERMLKVIVYLSDVGEDCGPFEAVDAVRTEQATRVMDYQWGTLRPEEELAKVVPPAERMRVTGPRFTAIFADTARCLHRATPPTGHDRYSMTYSYVSRRAYFCFAESLELQRRYRERWSDLLDARGREAISPL